MFTRSVEIGLFDQQMVITYFQKWTDFYRLNRMVASYKSMRLKTLDCNCGVDELNSHNKGVC